MLDRETEEWILGEANQHLAEARERVRAQRRRLKQIKVNGEFKEDAQKLLDTMISVLETMEMRQMHIQEVLAEMNDSSSPPS
jgi:DNA repair exonuclease SbcCD ATPase subunit